MDWCTCINKTSIEKNKAAKLDLVRPRPRNGPRATSRLLQEKLRIVSNTSSWSDRPPPNPNPSRTTTCVKINVRVCISPILYCSSLIRDCVHTRTGSEIVMQAFVSNGEENSRNFIKTINNCNITICYGETTGFSILDKRNCKNISSSDGNGILSSSSRRIP